MVVPATVEWHGIYQDDMAYFLKQAKALEKEEKAAVVAKEEAKIAEKTRKEKIKEVVNQRNKHKKQKR